MLEDILATIKSKNYHSAFSALSKIKVEEPEFEAAMQVWFNLAVQLRQLDEALKPLRQLWQLFPSKAHYTNVYKELLTQGAHYAELVGVLERELKEQQTISPDDYFNLGFYARKAGQASKAISYFDSAISQGVSDCHEVYLNLALVYSELLNQDDTAIVHLQKSLAINPKYQAALHNLGNLYEQHGRLQEAKALFEQLLDLDDSNLTAQARLSDLDVYTKDKAQEYEIKSLSALKNNSDTQGAVDLYYGLGKVFDDAKDYKKAWHYYVQANELNKTILPAYERNFYENLLIDCHNRNVEISAVSETVQPVIICGMFRSGSTLLERIIGSSQLVAMGGEIDYLHKHLFGKQGDAFVNVVSNEKFAADYLHTLNRVSTQSRFITDKRPENFMYIDVVKALFPSAKIVWTERNRLDNCLSAYFQRLGTTQNYATDLGDTLHYYSIQERMLGIWQAKFPEDIKVVNYDALVRSPELATRDLFEFLELPYNHEDKQFHKLDGGVKTASVWQVRRPLYQSSSGRIQNYKDAILDSEVGGEFSALLNRYV